LSVALVSPMFETDLVVAAGALEATKVWSLPWLVPASLVAVSR